MWVLRLTSFEYCLFMHTILNQQLFQFCGHWSCDFVYWYLVLASQVHEIIILHLFTFQNWNMQHWNMKSQKCFSFSNYAVLEIFFLKISGLNTKSFMHTANLFCVLKQCSFFFYKYMCTRYMYRLKAWCSWDTMIYERYLGLIIKKINLKIFIA